MAKILIGTSGWHYDSWRGPFYPPNLMLKHQLQFYATQFSTAELNGVFYRTPSRKAVEGWRDQTDASFVFSWKASKYITHWKRLSPDTANSLDLMEDRMSFLKNKLGPILFQLPPNFKANREKLATFIKQLSKKRRYTFEFRHPSWYDPAVFKVLTANNIALCISDHHNAPSPWKRTADFIYVRGHGPGGRYKGHYNPAELLDWTKRIKSWKARGYDVFVYFDNDQKSAAPLDAARLKRLIGKGAA